MAMMTRTGGRQGRRRAPRQMAMASTRRAPTPSLTQSPGRLYRVTLRTRFLLSHQLARQLTNDRFAMNEPRLAEVVDAVQGARSAFQNLCGVRTPSRVQADSRDLQAFKLDVSLQALGNVVEILEGVVSRGTRVQLVEDILAAPALKSGSDNPTSLANAIIADMRNLQARLIDVQCKVSPSSVQNYGTSIELLPLGEAMSMRRMIQKYRSIIGDACSGQIMCVITLQIVVSVLTSSRSSVDETMEDITAMRKQMEESKQMDQSVIMRA
jgi:hypothetical protein